MRSVPLVALKKEYEYMKEEVNTAVCGCLQHQQWIRGPEVEELERRMERFLGTAHCIGVSSGTDALLLALRASAIRFTGKEYFERSDEVITTAFTFIASGDAILRSGATPLFVDIDSVTMNINTGAVRECLENNNSRVVGILPVHLFGQPCNMDELMDLTSTGKVFLVEDTAQALGSAWSGKRLGSFGDFAALSFFPTKNLGGYGDGGMVCAGDDEAAILVRMLSQHGGFQKYSPELIGYNSRLDTLQAAILLAKMKFLEEMNERRRGIASRYDEGLRGIDEIIPPVSNPEAYTAYNQYTIRVLGGRRDDLAGYLRGKGIATAVYYPFPLHLVPVFRDRMKVHGTLFQAEKAAAEVLSLPIEPLMDMVDVDYVVETIKKGMG